MEKITIEIPKGNWNMLLESFDNKYSRQLKANEDYTIKKIEVEDDFFKDDPTWQTMKKESNQCYKRLKEYEFRARNR